ncbi:MAG: 23S rRNA (adenine(2503)-C(2))-methyltransferase RlmN, partial [Bartonella sp.]|nr:23S rRNA (adenine(2503)-C(2))-methyltransferase RlmN [Bartonella sp.]
MAISYDLRSTETYQILKAKSTVVTKPPKLSLIGLSHDEMAQALQAIGVPEHQTQMRVRQFWHWLYVRGISHFDEMLNISKSMREILKEHFSIARPEIVAEQISQDGTRKWLLRFPASGAGKPVEVETVYIPEEGRGTLCISSQV